MKNRIPSLVGAFGLGALWMYLLDPVRGTSRRAMLTGRMIKASHQLQKGGTKTARDLRNRIMGIVYTVRSWARKPSAIPDIVLAARVRSKLGTLVLHPRSIEVTVDQGRVTLTGSVYADEAQRVVDRVSRIRGVSSLANRLSFHDMEDSFETAGDYGARLGPVGAFPPSTPASRFLAGAAGGTLILYSLFCRRSPIGLVLKGMGTALLSVSVIAASTRGQNLFRLALDKDPTMPPIGHERRGTLPLMNEGECKIKS